MIPIETLAGATASEPEPPMPELRRAEQDEERAEKRRFPYLPGFDGIRGIGVVLMLLWHAQVTWIGDGTLFVLELFFVLSGFLITSLFIVEHHNTDRIDLKRFWTRRFRRLFPALIGIFPLVAVYAAWFASQVELSKIRGDGISSILYFSNWYFIFSGSSYFEGFATPSPFRHTWSLSIEEQFYLMVALVVAFGFVKWGHHRKRWMYGALAISIASALWMALLTRIGQLTAEGLWPFGIDPDSLPEGVRIFFNFQGTGDPSRVYYGTDTRLQGSMMGVFMAFLLIRLDLSKLKNWMVEAASVVGILGLLAMFLLIPKNSGWIYYGGFFLADVLTALAIVSLMAPHKPLIVRGLGWKPFVYVGTLSYSIYVWHWPIFVFLDESRIPVRGWQFDAVRIGASFVVGFVSFKLYENPIRIRGLRDNRRRLAAAVSIVVVIAGFLLATGNAGVQERSITRSADGRAVVLFAGDSMAHTLALDVNLSGADRAAGVQAELATVLGCGIGDADSIVGGQAVKRNPECKEWETLWPSQVQKVNPAVSIVIAWGWDLYDRRIPDANGDYREVEVGSDEWKQWYEATIQSGIDKLTARGGKVALTTLPCIDLDADVPNHPNPESAEPHRVKAMNEAIMDVAARNRATTFVMDVNKLMCPDGSHYRAKIDGKQMSDDGLHFTPDGAAYVWSWMVPQIEENIGIPLTPTQPLAK
ncbi:MAG: acyltransferase family protein [Acidimicrobiales bacterium]